MFGFVFLMEASTPFVSLRGILSRFGMKTSKLYVINGLLMLGSFFICRIVMFPYVIYLYANFIQVDYITVSIINHYIIFITYYYNFQAIYSLPKGCKISMSILLIPQFYWFFLMLKGAKQVLKPKRFSNNVNHTKKKRHSSNSNS